MNEELNLSQEVTLNVNTFDDQNDGSNIDGLSLRDAVIIAANDQQNDYIINLEAGTYNLFLEDGGLIVSNNVQIIGVSSDETIIDGSFLNDNVNPIFSFPVPRTSITLENLTIQNANAASIANFSNTKLLINNSVIKDNQGGGIINNGLLELNDSMVIDNTANVNNGGLAGGIYNGGTGIANINDSTIANNIGFGTAGGILNDFTQADSTLGGELTVVNSTISGNTSVPVLVEDTFQGGIGGGILARKAPPEGEDDAANLNTVKTNIFNSTIVNNQASFGAGIFSEEDSLFSNNLIVQNSIIADNVDGSDITGFFNETSSHNIIGYGNSNLLNGVNNNLVGTSNSPADPLVTELQNNGGPTLTHALLPNSPAIDAGDNSVTEIRSLFTTTNPTDQRGSQRISNGIIDIGSYELLNQSDAELNTPIYRFQNQSQIGSYLYVAEEERQNISANFPEFVEEGFAFNVGVEAQDDLIPLYRFQNSDVPGTYLYAGPQERQSILVNNTNFVEEGIAFYVFGANANQGEDIYRFQNTSLPGTYLFVGEQEKNSILQNNLNFVLEGVAFEVNA